MPRAWTKIKLSENEYSRLLRNWIKQDPDHHTVFVDWISIITDGTGRFRSRLVRNPKEKNTYELGRERSIWFRDPKKALVFRLKHL